ncbi:MAG: hypothetical protein H6766_02820 [Candidatus Peribacteria bacterium]|nr:MAG: hypothetical protein H6766_02820 [Candidatus Peribacteria bacterium]
MLHIIQHIIQTNDLVGGLSRMPTSNAIKNLETTIKNEIQKLIEEKSKIKIDLVKIQNINIDHINVTILSTQDANTQNKAKIICKVSLSYSYRKTHHGNIIVYI